MGVNPAEIDRVRLGPWKAQNMEHLDIRCTAQGQHRQSFVLHLSFEHLVRRCFIVRHPRFRRRLPVRARRLEYGEVDKARLYAPRQTHASAVYDDFSILGAVVQ